MLALPASELIPVIRSKRDTQGKLTSVFQKKDKGGGKGQGQAESVMQFQIDRKTRPEDLEKLSDGSYPA